MSISVFASPWVNTSGGATATAQLSSADGPVPQICLMDRSDYHILQTDCVVEKAVSLSDYPFTIVGWVWAEPSGTETIAGVGDGTNNWNVDIAATGELSLDANGTASSGSTKQINDHRIHSFVATFRSATDRELYIDEISDDTDATSVASVSLDDLHIGASETGTPAQFATVLALSIGVFNSAFDDADVQEFYQLGFTSSPSDHSSWGAGCVEAVNNGKYWGGGTVTGSPVTTSIPAEA